MAWNVSLETYPHYKLMWCVGFLLFLFAADWRADIWTAADRWDHNCVTLASVLILGHYVQVFLVFVLIFVSVTHAAIIVVVSGLLNDGNYDCCWVAFHCRVTAVVLKYFICDVHCAMVNSISVINWQFKRWGFDCHSHICMLHLFSCKISLIVYHWLFMIIHFSLLLSVIGLSWD